jgi:hypothetical protein
MPAYERIKQLEGALRPRASHTRQRGQRESGRRKARSASQMPRASSGASRYTAPTWLEPRKHIARRATPLRTANERGETRRFLGRIGSGQQMNRLVNGGSAYLQLRFRNLQHPLETLFRSFDAVLHISFDVTTDAVRAFRSWPPAPEGWNLLGIARRSTPSSDHRRSRLLMH